MRREKDFAVKLINSRFFMSMFYTMLFMGMVGLCGCSSGGGNPSAPLEKIPDSIAVQPADNKLAVGENLQFTLVDIYADGTSTPNTTTPLTWESSKPEVATINPGNGMASAVAPGQTTITVKFGGESRSTTLTVPGITLVSIAITPLNPTIAVKTTQEFTATGAYSDGSFQRLTSGVTWRSSDPSKATISQNGTATAIAAGTTVISAEVGGIVSPTTALNITSTSLVSITVSPSTLTLAVETSQQLTATGTFSDGTTQDLTSQVTWISSDPSKITINQNGEATAITSGTTTISAGVADIVSPAANVTVTQASLVSITVTSPNQIIDAGTTEQFTATGIFSDGTTQNLTSQASWVLSDTSIATISGNGTVTAIKSGIISVTASFGSVSGSRNLEIANVSAAGTWDGTYTIYDSVDPKEIGTYKYNYKLMLNQSGTEITGTSTLRYDIPAQKADGVFIEGIVTGNQISFTFTYNDPRTFRKMVNIGTATISGTTMTGTVVENYNGGFNCRYLFTLNKGVAK